MSSDVPSDFPMRPANRAPGLRPVDVTGASATDDETRRATGADARLHRVLLGVASLVVVLACVLEVRAGTEVVVPWLDVPVPGVCTYKRWFGSDCPGCGLTRCFVSLAHGDVAAAWRFNPAGLLFFAIVAAQIPFRALQLWRIRRGRPELFLGRLGHIPFAFLVLALIVQWFSRL